MPIERESKIGIQLDNKPNYTGNTTMNIYELIIIKIITKLNIIRLPSSNILSFTSSWTMKIILAASCQNHHHILNQCCGSGSGIRCFFTPRIRDGAMVGSGTSKQNLLIAFIQKEVGSGIRCFFTPRIRSGMEQWSDPG
jgi:hypothetical protein